MNECAAAVASNGRVWSFLAPHARQFDHDPVRVCSVARALGGLREAYVSAQHTPPSQEARLSRSHEHPWRPGRSEEPPRQGPRPSIGLIGSIRSRRSFTELSRTGRRVSRSFLWCTWCLDPTASHASVAFAITRAYGPAVRRNKLRRQLRAVLVELDRAEPLPPIMIMMGPRGARKERTFAQIQQAVTAMIHEIRQQLSA